MKNLSNYLKILLLSTLFLIGCSKQNLVELPQLQSNAKLAAKTSSRTGLKPIGSGVMMQAFYWDVPSGGV